MKGFTKGMVRRRGLVILICLLLMIPSVLGMAATKTKYDLLYYLPQDLETVRGQEILLQDFMAQEVIESFPQRTARFVLRRV